MDIDALFPRTEEPVFDLEYFEPRKRSTIQELMDKPYDLNYAFGRYDKRASFITDDRNSYEVSLILDEHQYVDGLSLGTWELMFKLKRTPDSYIDSVDIENTGDQFRVMTTVIEAAREFLSALEDDDSKIAVRPFLVYFTAKEENRTRLYDLLVRKLTRNSKYQVITDDDISQLEDYSMTMEDTDDAQSLLHLANNLKGLYETRNEAIFMIVNEDLYNRVRDLASS